MLMATARISLGGDYQKFGFGVNSFLTPIGFYFDTYDARFGPTINSIRALVLSGSTGTELLNVGIPVSWGTYHNFTVNWTPTTVSFFIDGKRVANYKYNATSVALPVGVWNDRMPTMITDIVKVSAGPTVTTLAKLAEDAYSPIAFGADGYSIIDDILTIDGLSANAYQKNNHIVIAIRGTDTQSNKETTIKNFLGDTSFGTGTPNLQFIKYTVDIVDFLAGIAAQHSNADITLTGHSLGGGIAQLLGATANLRTITFDAPGPAALLSPLIGLGLLKPIANLQNFSTSPEITNYRLYGDAISLVGTQLGGSVTVDPPANLARMDIDNAPWNFLDYHGIELLRLQISADATETEGVIGGTPLVLGVNYIVPTTAANNTLRFFVNAASGIEYLLDPLPGIGYTLLADTSSPFFHSIGLPHLDTVSAWRLNYLVNGVWSSDQFLTGLDDFIFGPNVNGVRFFPLDSDGLPVFNVSPFAFGLSFTSDGVFSGTLLIDPGPETVPEPPDCSDAIASPAQLWPPNHKMVPIEILGVTDPNRDSVAITVTAVQQNEPLLGTGNNDACPDSSGIGTATALVRAERSGEGLGRVYYISFIAVDGKGGQCAGTVTVCVPHDQGAGATCVDNGVMVPLAGFCK